MLQVCVVLYVKGIVRCFCLSKHISSDNAIRFEVTTSDMIRSIFVFAYLHLFCRDQNHPRSYDAKKKSKNNFHLRG